MLWEAGVPRFESWYPDNERVPLLNDYSITALFS